MNGNWAPYEIKRIDGDDDAVMVIDRDDIEEFYEVVQRGFWFWRTFFIGFFIPPMAAGGVAGSGHFRKCSEYFDTRDDARQALYAGSFKDAHGYF